MLNTYASSLSIILAMQSAFAFSDLIENVKNVEQIGELDGTEIRGGNYIEWPRKPGQRFAKKLECVEGFQLTVSGKYAACCLPCQTLVGSFETVFECCGEGHELAGSKETGYSCCPTGQEYDGSVCKPKAPVCSNGKVLVDGKCVCPDGQTETPSGGCQPAVTPGGPCQPAECQSGLKTGKCYTFTDDRGLLYGYSNAGWYSAAKDSRNHIFGKFQLCGDEACTPGKAVNPDTSIAIKDIHGQANSGANANQWLDNKSNGGHIGKTPAWDKAGKFSLTKWPCGKYCLGGFDSGLGPTCPSEEPAFTFNTADKQACQVVKLTEVPCDIHAVDNNCIWKSGDQCCDPIDCSKTDSGNCQTTPSTPQLGQDPSTLAPGQQPLSQG